MRRQGNFARACGDSPFVPRLTPNVGISTRPEFNLDGREYRLRRRLARSTRMFVVKGNFTLAVIRRCSFGTGNAFRSRRREEETYETSYSRLGDTWIYRPGEHGKPYRTTSA